MSTLDQAHTIRRRGLLAELLEAVDDRTVEILRRRERSTVLKRRGWLVRRALLTADVLGLLLAFAAALALDAGPTSGGELVLFALTIPLWVVVAKLLGLYERDEERADHSTVDDVVGVFHLITIGSWLLLLASLATGLSIPLGQLITFWVLGLGFVTCARAFARSACRRSYAYLQNTIIFGAGDVGQLVARKLLKHPEYGLNLVGFVDEDPKERRDDLEHLTLLGGPERLREIIDLLDVERVVIAFSNEPEERTLAVVRTLKSLDVQVDVVPRLFELVGPKVDMHTIEGLSLVGLAPVRLTPSSRLLKRALDVAVASIALVLTAPLFAFVAWRVKRDSPGPILFRQTRLGLNMKEFTAFKFRTMRQDVDQSAHREYIRRTASGVAATNGNGLFKLDRADVVTRSGAWLRKTSLDELPQLINVLRGDMSLVGPRPCIPYETENFEPHHYERFEVPAGITGLWQVTARANSTFGEALEMDVAYSRGWSLGLDLRLLFRTPLQLLRQRKATA